MNTNGEREYLYLQSSVRYEFFLFYFNYLIIYETHNKIIKYVIQIILNMKT